MMLHFWQLLEDARIAMVILKRIKWKILNVRNVAVPRWNIKRFHLIRAPIVNNVANG